MNKGGDVLARGAARAQFRACEPGVTQEMWNRAFGISDKDAGGSKKRKKKSKR